MQNQIIESISLNKALLNIGKKEIDIQKLANESLIDPFVIIPKPPSVLEIDGVVYGTLGNFSVLNGKPKSRKSFSATALFIASLDSNNFSYKPRIVNKNPYRTGLYFDTEQSDYHVSKIGQRIINKLDIDRDKCKFKLYGLRQHSPSLRLQIIERELYSNDDIGLVVIDGIADLISNGYNDEADSIMIANKLLKWTKELNIHIIAIIHQNKGDNNAKGHIGSQLMQKAETVLNIERCKDNKEYSIITPAYSRGIDIEPIYFTIDENGIPLLEKEPARETSTKNKKRPIDFENSYVEKIILDVFTNESDITYTDLWNKIKYYNSINGYVIGDNIAKEWVTHYKEVHAIIQDNKKHYSLNQKVFSTDNLVF